MGTIIPGLSALGNNGNEGVLDISETSRTGALTSDRFVSRIHVTEMQLACSTSPVGCNDKMFNHKTN